jgi:predicted nucleotidyltransferase
MHGRRTGAGHECRRGFPTTYTEHALDSDLDLLIDLPPGASLFDLSRLGLALEDALGRPVDLVTSFASLHPVLQERIRREEEVLL